MLLHLAQLLLPSFSTRLFFFSPLACIFKRPFADLFLAGLLLLLQHAEGAGPCRVRKAVATRLFVCKSLLASGKRASFYAWAAALS